MPRSQNARLQSARPKSARPKSIRPKSIRPKSIRPKSIRPKSIRPKSIRPKSIRPKSIRRSVGAEIFPETDERHRVRPRVGQFHSAGQESNLVNHVLRSCSRMIWLLTFGVQKDENKRDRRSVDQRRYGALPTELRPDVNELGRWDSNPRQPACDACTPNRQSIVFPCYFCFFFKFLRNRLHISRPLSRSSRTSCCCRVSKVVMPPFGRFV